MHFQGSVDIVSLVVHPFFQVLSRACGLVTKGELQDPKVATWLLDPGAKERNFYQLVEHFLPQETGLLQGITKTNNFIFLREHGNNRFLY